MSNEKNKALSTTAQREAQARLVNARQAEKPPIMPACRNCKHLSYDASERMGARGEIVEKINKHCVANDFKVTSNIVCDRHDFRHADRRDV